MLRESVSNNNNDKMVVNEYMSSSPSPKTKTKRRILVVDDESDITFTLKKGLEQGGYDVHVFNDPLVALMVVYHLVKNFSEVS